MGTIGCPAGEFTPAGSKLGCPYLGKPNSLTAWCAPVRTFGGTTGGYSVHLSRHVSQRLFASLIGAVALLGMTACGVAASSPSGSASAAATRTVDSTHGKISVPDHPQRVV